MLKLGLHLLLPHHLGFDQLVVASVRLCLGVSRFYLRLLFLLFLRLLWRRDLFRRRRLLSLDWRWVSWIDSGLSLQILSRALPSEFYLRLDVVLVIFLFLLHLLILFYLLF